MFFRSQITLWVHCSKVWVLSVTFQAVVETGRCLNLAEKKKNPFEYWDAETPSFAAVSRNDYRRFFLPCEEPSRGRPESYFRVPTEDGGTQPRGERCALVGEQPLCRTSDPTQAGL